MSDRRRELYDLLSPIRWRWTAMVRLRWAGRTAALVAVPLLAAAALWSRTVAGWPVTGLAASGIVVAAAGIAVLAVRAGERKPDDRRLARFIEEAVGRQQGVPSSDVIVSALHVAQRAGPAGAFDDLVLSRAVSDLRSIAPADVVPPAACRRAFLTAALGLILLGAGLISAMPLLRAGVGEAWVRMVPRSVEVAVLGGDLRVRAGEPLILRAVVGGPGARWLSRPPVVAIAAGGDAQQLEMTQPAGHGVFVHQIDAVTRSFTYQVRAAGALSDTYRVTAVRAPRVTQIDLQYSYPAFIRLPPRQEEDGGDIYGPAGTKVRLVVHADAPAAGGDLVRAAGGSVPLTRLDATTLSADLVVAQDDTYRVALVDPDGLRSDGGPAYFIRVTSDRPPAVRIVRPATDRGITPLQEVVIEASADDDHGIAAFDLVITVAGRTPRTVPFTRLDGGPTSRSGRYTLEAESLDVQPGDVIAYFARARDVPHGRRSVEARSEMFFLDVQPFGEAFAAAESRAAGGAGATPLDGLVAAQKEIISATWNLERRALAGRSTDDVRAVERAQRELRMRAERLQNASGRRRPGMLQQIRMPPAGRGAGSPDHVSLALDAMDRAAERLSTARTADAIPHELAALRALLQAQAEIRRRQVMQQASSGGGGGSGRADRDLSALFDRELQRQQETRYELAPGARPDQEPEPPGELAERVRELAERQGDLARRQRELASEAQSEEALKRELARLLREQEELRRGIEALNRRDTESAGEARTRGTAAGRAGARGAQERGPAGGRSPGTPRAGGPAQDGMDQAAEAMRRASDEMRRASPGRAAAHAEAAAEALRQRERNLRGGASDRRPTSEAAGDLDRTLRIRDELNRLARQVRDAERQLQAAERASAAGRPGGKGARDEAQAARDALQRARDAFARGLERAREALAAPHDGLSGSTPERHEFSRASPGTEAFEQDVSAWDALRERVDRALEPLEASAVTTQRSADQDGRLSAGGSDRVPEAYRTMVSRYFEAIARTVK